MQDNTPPEPIPQDAKRVPGYEDYWATKCGEVWSTKRLTPKRLTPAKDKDGYSRIVLYGESGPANWQVHRAVLITFYRSPKPHEQCRHLNGKPSDNRLENITWGTPKENAMDRKRHGTQARGQKSGASTLTANQVKNIRVRYKDDRISHKALSEEYGVSIHHIGRIIRGEVWVHAGGPITHDTTARGVRCPHAKLNCELVTKIRTEYQDTDATQSNLANKYAVSLSTMNELLTGSTWKHADGPIKSKNGKEQK